MASVRDDTQYANDFLDRLPSQERRDWYLLKNPDISFQLLKGIIARLEKEGFEMQSNGLYLRHSSSQEGKLIQSPATIVEVAFTRRSDAHIHPSMDEIFTVNDGSGTLYENPYDSTTFRDLLRTTSLAPVMRPYTIRATIPHAFRPGPDGLIIYLETTKLYTGDEERQMIPFDKLELPN